MKIVSRHVSAVTVVSFLCLLVLISPFDVNAQTPAAPAKSAPVAKAAPAPAAKPAEVINPKLDPALKQRLDELNFKPTAYDVNVEGVVRIRYDLDGGRSQNIFVASKTDSFIGVEFRKIWATAMKSKEIPSAEILAKLMQDTAQKKLGAWELVRWPDGYRILFAVRVPADCSAAVLKAGLKIVLNGADLMEEQLTGKDEF